MPRVQLATAAAFTAAVVALPGIAQANWAGTAVGSATIKARTSISNATGTLASSCVAQSGPDDVKLTWGLSPDSAFVSYAIDRTGGAGPITLPLVAGNLVTTNDTSTAWAAAPNGNHTYTYTIRAVVGTAPWTTAAAGSTTRTFNKAGKCS
ncbi:MAG: hypothetical protein JWP11_2206 [Frankiales bacterium]|nr:hypothetical protein [Frankiales bacterium]